MNLFRDLFRYAKHKNTVIGILSVWLLFSMRGCYDRGVKLDDLETQISIDSLDFIVRTSKDGAKIAEQEVKIISDKNTMKKLVSEVNGLREINTQVKATTITKIVNVESEPTGGELTIIHDTTYIDSSLIRNSYLKLPQSYKTLKSEWVSISYTITKSGVSIVDSASFVSKPIITFGYKDEGFVKNLLKKDVPIVSYQDQNPYTEVQGLQNLEFQPKKKWYQRKTVWMGAGVVIGIILTK